ncbi:hypothetical protein JCM10450v2_004165 [Rhodotorula kratochvilovae]
MQGTRLHLGNPSEPAFASSHALPGAGDAHLSPVASTSSTASFPSDAREQPHTASGSLAAVPADIAHLDLPASALDPALADTPFDPALLSSPAEGDALVLPTPPAHFLASEGAPTHPTPQDPAAQISLLGTLNADADTALVANRAYQRALMAAMARIEHARERAAVLKTVVASLAADLAAPATTSNGSTHELRVHAPGVVEPQLPYFWAMYGKDLPLNEDAKARERYLSAVQAHPWHAAERKKLRKEVVAQNHRLVAREAMLRGEDPAALLAQRKADDPEWFVENLQKLDWDSLALVFEHRTPKACKIQWLAREHPRVNRSKKWSASERAQLLALVDERRAVEEGRWDEVAEALEQWAKRPAPRTKWTQEDDVRLRGAVQAWGENWDVVARETGYAAQQCLHRYLHSLFPGVARGRFTPDEDAKIEAAVAAFGTRNWSAVAARVGARTEAQCRERWGKYLDPDIHVKGSSGWTEEEDALILRLRDDDRLGWSEIAQRGFNKQRSANHISRRYHQLKGKPDGAAGEKGKTPAPAREKVKGRAGHKRGREEGEGEEGEEGVAPKRRKTGKKAQEERGAAVVGGVGRG